MDTEKYLIIGGSTKCGTTSVFKYFEFHPDVCPCEMKESRYFLGETYQLHAAKRSHDKYESFSQLFRNCNVNQVRFEATPDYLYSETARKNIKRELLNCKLIFILRDPIDRLISWYTFASLNGLIEKSVTFEQFVNLQNENKDEDAPQHLRSMEQGRYSKYIQHYLNDFDAGRIMICYYEDLQSDPYSFCKNICRFSGINEQYFDDFNFIIYNKSVPVKSVGMHQLFRKIRRGIRPVARMLPQRIHKKLKLAGYKVEQTYLSANEDKNVTRLVIGDSMLRKLMSYYREDVNSLKTITGGAIPWKRFTSE